MGVNICCIYPKKCLKTSLNNKKKDPNCLSSVQLCCTIVSNNKSILLAILYYSLWYFFNKNIKYDSFTATPQQIPEFGEMILNQSFNGLFCPSSIAITWSNERMQHLQPQGDQGHMIAHTNGEPRSGRQTPFRAEKPNWQVPMWYLFLV